MTRAGLLAACLLGLSGCGTEAPWAARGQPESSATSLPSAPPDRPPSPATSATDLERALSHAAWARVRWPGGEVLEAHDLPHLDEPVPAGSIFKLVAARAAVEQGVADARFVCPRRVETHGRRVDCVHPDLGRPLTLEDALAHSCNHYFVRLAERLDRGRLGDLLRQLSQGQASAIEEAPLPLVLLGLEGPTQGMRGWLTTAIASARDVGGPSARLAPVRRGAARAATDGTASTLHDAVVITYAKTGTTVPGGVQDGRVVAWRPESGEAVVVRAAGVPGRDAARLAAAIWARAAAADETRIRVGRLRTRGDGARPVVDVLPLETYVAAVVAAEGEPTMGEAALDALAVAARSYARLPDPRHARDGFDVCDTTHCQVAGAATAWSTRAATATRGLVLTHQGRVVRVPYSASCGGTLVSPRDLWGGREPRVTAIGREPAPHPVARWSREVEASALLAVLHEAGQRGTALRNVRVVARADGGVPLRVALDGLVPGELPAGTFRLLIGRRLGWDVLKSDAWDVAATGRGFRFSGQGKGHGAGLCLAGAASMAARGATAARILGAYVPRAQVWSDGDALSLRLPAALEGRAATLGREARTLLATLRQRLRVTAPRELIVEVHPTREAYQRKTGRAWWTAASTRPLGSGHYRIDVAPPADLPALAGLLNTLGHEFTHVLTAAALADAPAWLGEGLAMLAPRLAHAEQAGSAGPCPTDDELGRPGSLEAMRIAYARAAACVLQHLPDGIGSWRRVGE